MKLITWNIQWGLGMDGRLDLARIVVRGAAARRFRCAVPAGGRGRFRRSRAARRREPVRADRGAAAGIRRRRRHCRRSAGREVRRRRFGNMILSRLPVGRILRHALPWDADPTTRNMPRSLLEVEVQATFGPVRVMTTHLEYHSAPLRSAQVAAIREIHRTRRAARATAAAAGCRSLRDGQGAGRGHSHRRFQYAAGRSGEAEFVDVHCRWLAGLAGRVGGAASRHRASALVLHRRPEVWTAALLRFRLCEQRSRAAAAREWNMKRRPEHRITSLRSYI